MSICQPECSDESKTIPLKKTAGTTTSAISHRFRNIRY
jgi:hypothetical protein